MPKAKNLKYLRIKSGLTQKQLADIIGVSVPTIRSWENKHTAITTNHTMNLATFFHVGFSEFCDIDLEQMDAELSGADIKLTEQEAHNIILFRKLPEEVKHTIRFLITAAVAYRKED